MYKPSLKEKVIATIVFIILGFIPIFVTTFWNNDFDLYNIPVTNYMKYLMWWFGCSIFCLICLFWFDEKKLNILSSVYFVILCIAGIVVAIYDVGFFVFLVVAIVSILFYIFIRKALWNVILAIGMFFLVFCLFLSLRLLLIDTNFIILLSIIFFAVLLKTFYSKLVTFLHNKFNSVILCKPNEITNIVKMSYLFITIICFIFFDDAINSHMSTLLLIGYLIYDIDFTYFKSI